MDASLSISTRNNAESNIDVPHTLGLTISLLTSIGSFTRHFAQLDPQSIRPRIAQSTIATTFAPNENGDLFSSASNPFEPLSDAINLVNHSERILHERLLDRRIRNPIAAFPIPIVYDPDQPHLLSYDEAADCIRTKHPAAVKVVKRTEASLRILSAIEGFGLSANLVIDNTSISLPEASPTIFGYKPTMGPATASAIEITGYYPVGKEVETRLSGIQDNKTLRASVTEEVSNKISGLPFPIRASASVREFFPTLPLLPRTRSKVLIEDIWDIERSGTLGS